MRRSGKGKDMDRHSLMLGLRLAILTALLSMGITSPALAFFPPDPIPQNNVVPPPPPTEPHTPPPECCHCCPPPPGPHVGTPEPMTVVSSLIGLSILGGYGLRKRWFGK